MGSQVQISRISRREFLKLALTSSETLLLLPILEACERARGQQPPP